MKSTIVNWQLTLTSVIPILVISLVCLQLLYKAYVKIRSRFSIRVNCWFCNQDAKVPYLEYNSWTCTYCEQYNGFDKSGDYNREIPQQQNRSRSSNGSAYFAFVNGTTDHDSIVGSTNGFCDACNEAQRLKIEKVAQFEPKKEKNFEKELKVYKAQLEAQYRICTTCEKHLKKVLRECKKKVIGAKFIDFVLKSADAIVQPHVQMMRLAKNQHWKQNLTFLLTCFSFLNIWYIASVEIDSFKRAEVRQYFGETLGDYLFIMISHILALLHTLNSYLLSFLELELMLKLRLFLQTIIMLSLYTVGVKLPLHALYVQIYPFVVLALALLHNIVDRFKLTRHTFLLVLWSTFAGGFLKDLPIGWMCLSSLLTLFLSITNRIPNSPKLLDNTATSFHKLYADDSFSEDETESFLSPFIQSPSVRSFQSAYTMARSSSPCPATASRIGTIAANSNNYLRHIPYQHTAANPSFIYNQQKSSLHMKPSSFNQSIYSPSMSNYSTLLPNNSINSSNARPVSRVPTVYDKRNDDILSGNMTINDSFHTRLNTRAIREIPASAAPTERNYLHRSLNAANSSLNHLSSPALNESCFSITSAKNPSTSFNFAGVPLLRSPYSFSNGEVRHKTVLSPSRFSTTDLPSRFSINDYNECRRHLQEAAWLTRKPINFNYPSMQQVNSLHAHITANNLPNDTTSMLNDDKSRSSSHSSGFESQNDRPTASRENSLGLDVNGGVDSFASRTLTANSFRPIEPLRRNLENLSNYPEPTLAAHRLRSSNANPFNLNKLADGLETIQRGDLLKKWMNSQTGGNLVE